MSMSELLPSYLDYVRGKQPGSPWRLIKPFHYVSLPFVALRNHFFDRGILKIVEPPVPVISVGNISFGGTNKTPTVEMIARALWRMGLRVGVVSRGYGGKTREPLWLDPHNRDWDPSVTGDEPLMLAMKFPEAKVVIARDRLEGIELLAELGVDVVVADDAFQHRWLGRDLDIVLVDATLPVGNGLLLPAGLLRETPRALERADLVVITKADQVSAESLEQTRELLARYAPPEKIFTAHLKLQDWTSLRDGDQGQSVLAESGFSVPACPVYAFSAIGNPDSFHRFLDVQGVRRVGGKIFRDHHRFTHKDLADLASLARAQGASALVCTEKDFYNLPAQNLSAVVEMAIHVPRIAIDIDDAPRFWGAATEKLRPHFVVASNGYGEDAIGTLLAKRIKKSFPEAIVSAFALVGTGKQYRKGGIDVASPPSELPSGGVIKYSLRALVRDIRHGLHRDIGLQIERWNQLRGQIRTPVCVGDFYLLVHVLWGQGITPLLIAAAKTVQIDGHWRLERFFLRRRCRRVWTRDAETAEELKGGGVDAVFKGNPIMDLALEEEAESGLEKAAAGEDEKNTVVWSASQEEGGVLAGDAVASRILLLPGSRERAYEDVRLLLRAAEKISHDLRASFLLVCAPTLDRRRLESICASESFSVPVYTGPLAPAARGADLLLGLGGTANQVCAGLGVPVVSILEKGKLVQKKLLQEAEMLVEADPSALAQAAVRVLTTPELKGTMVQTGIRRLGGGGAVDDVVEYAATRLGWRLRHLLYQKLKERSACG